jgi:hypothetical protein
MEIVPLQSQPSQTISVVLNNQSCQINVYQKTYGLFLDLYVSNVLIIGGVLCENLKRCVRDLYLGFSGDLAFADTQSDTDPVYTGLGTQYQLVYLAPSDLPPGVG